MSTFYDSWAGSPEGWKWGVKLWYSAPDAGAGDPESYADFPSDPEPLMLGAGDPYLPGEGTQFWLPPVEIVVLPGAPTSELRTSGSHWVSWEGGTLLAVVSSSVLDKGPYRVDMVDAADQQHPLLEPGCYSAVQGSGTEISPEPDQYTLVFSTPPLPVGVYFIRVTDSEDTVVDTGVEVVVVMTPDSPEVDTVRRGLSPKVYPGAYPDQEYPDG